MADGIDQSKRIAKEAVEWAEKQKLLQLSEISLILDTYDDIFSDFDPRTLDKRSLSDDFLFELKRATKENMTGVIEINFLIPVEQRKTDKETMIKKRLRDHFKKHYDLVLKEIEKARNKGLVMIVIGVILSILTAIFVYPHEGANILFNVILVLIEPAAWFTVWEGANRIFGAWEDKKVDLDFYKKMTKSEISFTGY
ncbi:MAG: hypothetical protein WCW44_01685 [archaeon]|jgi:hypothetical protein